MKHSYSNFTEDLRVLCTRQHVKVRSSMRSFKPEPEERNYNVSLWIGEPTLSSIIVYSVLVPVVSVLGIIGNALVTAVICKQNAKTSTYVYLAVLAIADLVTCCLLVFSGLARGLFWCKKGWLEFDAFVHFPLGSVSSNITVWAIVCVTVDRLATVCCQPSCKLPKFCEKQVAQKMMITSSFLMVIFNLPYCFIYKYNEHGELMTTLFFHSWWYNLHNWLQLMIFGLVPAAFLLVANGIMCCSVRKMAKRRQVFVRCRSIREGHRLQDQIRLTIMLIAIVFVFIVGELPTHLASRRSAIFLLYGGDPTKVHKVFLERFRMYATLLNAISSSSNFILYSLLSPQFLCHVKELLRGKSAPQDCRLSMKGVLRAVEAP